MKLAAAYKGWDQKCGEGTEQEFKVRRQRAKLLHPRVQDHGGHRDHTEACGKDLLNGCFSVVNPPKRNRWSEEMGVNECHDRPTGQTPWLSLWFNKSTRDYSRALEKSCSS